MQSWWLRPRVYICCRDRLTGWEGDVSMVDCVQGRDTHRDSKQHPQKIESNTTERIVVGRGKTACKWTSTFGNIKITMEMSSKFPPTSPCPSCWRCPRSSSWYFLKCSVSFISTTGVAEPKCDLKWRVSQQRHPLAHHITFDWIVRYLCNDLNRHRHRHKNTQTRDRVPRQTHTTKRNNH